MKTRMEFAVPVTRAVFLVGTISATLGCGRVAFTMNDTGPGFVPVDASVGRPDAQTLPDSGAPLRMDAGAAGVDAGRSGRPDAGGSARLDAGLAPVDAGVAGDAGLRPAGGRLYVVTGTSQRLITYDIGADGTLTLRGSTDAYHMGRAITVRPDAAAVFYWAVDGSGNPSFVTYGISSGAPIAPGYGLDVGGGALREDPPLAVTPSGMFAYGGLSSSGTPSIVQVRSNATTFTLLTPYMVTIPSVPAGLAVSRGNDVLFVSMPAMGEVAPYAIAGDGRIAPAVAPATRTCADPTALVAHPSRTVLYVMCSTPPTLAAFSYSPDGSLATLGTPVAIAATPTDVAIDASGSYLVTLAQGGGEVDVLTVAADGSLRHSGSSLVSTSARGLAFDAMASRVFVVTTDSLDEYAFDPAALTMRRTTPLAVADGRAIASSH